MSQTTKTYALLTGKCPRCRRGKIFHGAMYGLSAYKMNETCPHCGFRFEIEPGYFYAAMYVSYAMVVAELVISGVLTFYLTNGSESPLLYIGVLIGIIVLLSPFNFRYSRIILLHRLTPRIKYNQDLDKD